MAHIGNSLRLFSIVDTKKNSSFFVFIFCRTLFYSDTKQKVGPKFLCFGILKHKKGSKFVSEGGGTQNTKLCMGRRGEGWRAAVEGLNGKVIDFNEIFSKTYSFVYFEIFCIVEATYSENMKPMCRFNQLCNFEAAYFFGIFFRNLNRSMCFFFSYFPP